MAVAPGWRDQRREMVERRRCRCAAAICGMAGQRETIDEHPRFISDDGERVLSIGQCRRGRCPEAGIETANLYDPAQLGQSCHDAAVVERAAGGDIEIAWEQQVRAAHDGPWSGCSSCRAPSGPS